MAGLYKKYHPLACAVCGKDVLENDGILVLVKDTDTATWISGVHVCCRGECEEKLRETHLGKNEINIPLAIADLKNPLLYLRYLTGVMDRLYDGIGIEREAYKRLKLVMLHIAQHVMREMTEEERRSGIRDIDNLI